MRLFGYLVLLLCGILDVTLGSSVKTLQSMSMEDAVLHLNERISLLESDLSQKVKSEIVVQVQNVEKRFAEEKNELATKLSEIDNKLNDLSTKLRELEERTSKHKEEISNALREMNATHTRSFDEVSERLRNEKMRLLLVDNQISMEMHQLQRRALETVENIHNMKSEIKNVSEAGRIRTDMLLVQMNGTRDLIHSCVASQRDTADAIRKNLSSSVEKLVTHVNESLTSQLENLTTNIGHLENSFLVFSRSCVNVSYASSLEESLQNLNKTAKSQIQSIQNDLYPRISLLEGRNDSKNEVMHMKEVLANHSSEISSLNTRLIRVQNRCSDPPYVENGYPVYSELEGRSHGAVITYACRGNKVPSENKVLKCHFGKWVGELLQCVDPVCNPPCRNGGTCFRNNSCSCTTDRCQNDAWQCGLDLRNVGVNESITVGTPAWPWMALLYIQKNERHPSSQYKCGGSVIHRHFILTAARCMYTSFKRPLRSSDLRIILGVADKTDPTHAVYRDVRTIYMHPQFSIRINYDYDIALLELEKPIDYNLYIRPVCLPPKEIPEDSIFYKTQSSMQAIGFGHNEAVSKSDKSSRYTTDFLKIIDLVIQPVDVCSRSLEDDEKVDRFTDRMFCAAEAKSFTCDGDDGGPAMQLHLSKEGTRIWTQVGIVGWRLGCGLQEEHGFFTNLQKLMPWVEATIEAALDR